MEQTNNQNNGHQIEPAIVHTAPTAPLASPISANPGQPTTVKPDPKRNWLIIGVCLVLVLAGAGLWIVHTKSKKQKSTQLTNVSVRLEWVNNPEFAGMYVAKEKGYYKAEGLNVDLKEFQDSTDVNKEVATGAVDYGVSTPLEVILARDKGQLNKSIAAIYQTSAYSVIAQKQSGINTPSDFKGKILGEAGGNNEAKVTYAALLAGAGISQSQVTLKAVDFDITKVFKDNQSDTFDAYRSDQVYLLDQAHIPYTQVFPEQYGFSIYGDILIASDSKIAKNPAQVAGFTRATLKGWQYAIAHQPETLNILAKYDNVLYKDPAYVKFDLSNTIPLIRPTGTQPLGGMQYVPWNRAYIAVKDSGLLKNTLDPTSFYTTDFVK